MNNRIVMWNENLRCLEKHLEETICFENHLFLWVNCVFIFIFLSFIFHFHFSVCAANVACFSFFSHRRYYRMAQWRRGSTRRRAGPGHQIAGAGSYCTSGDRWWVRQKDLNVFSPHLCKDLAFVMLLFRCLLRCTWGKGTSILFWIGLDGATETESGVYSSVGWGGWYQLFWQ